MSNKKSGGSSKTRPNVFRLLELSKNDVGLLNNFPLDTERNSTAFSV